MKSIERFRDGLVRLLLLFGLCAAGCVVDDDTGAASVQVATDALSAADIIGVTVTVDGPGIESAIVHDLSEYDGSWQGIIGEIPAGVGRTFTAQAFDDEGEVVYEGQTTDVIIAPDERVIVHILLQQETPPEPFENSAPIIDGLALSSAEVAPLDTVILSVTAHDPDPDDVISFEWTSSDGVFSDETSPTPVWTAPATEGALELTITARDTRGGVADMSFMIDVSEAHETGEAFIEVTVNTWPTISALTATPSRVDAGETLDVAIEATDADEDTLSCSWTDNGCGGSFENEHGENTTWTAPARYPAGGMCTLEVRVEDGRGGGNTGSITVHVVAPLEPNIAPAVDSWFQSADLINAGDVVTLRVRAHDPEGGDLSYFWTASSGTLGLQFDSPSGSELDWTSPPDRAGAPYTITVSIADESGLTTTVTFDIGLAVCDMESATSSIAPLLRGRHVHASPEHDGSVYIFGGQELIGQYVDCMADVWVYDIASNSYTDLGPILPYARCPLGPESGMMAWGDNGKLYLSPSLGPNVNNGWGRHRCIVEFDPATEMATERACFPSTRWNLGVVNVGDGFIYFMGGWNGRALSEIWQYDPATNTLLDTGGRSSVAFATSDLVPTGDGNTAYVWVNRYAGYDLYLFDAAAASMTLINDVNSVDIKLSWLGDDGLLYGFNRDTLVSYDPSTDTFVATPFTTPPLPMESGTSYALDDDAGHIYGFGARNETRDGFTTETGRINCIAGR